MGGIYIYICIYIIFFCNTSWFESPHFKLKVLFCVTKAVLNSILIFPTAVAVAVHIVAVSYHVSCTVLYIPLH